MPQVRRRPLLAQILAINALLVFVTVGVASLTLHLRLNLSAQRREFLVYLLGVCITLLVNALLLRRRVKPLERLIDNMERVDLAGPGARVAPQGADSREEVRLIGAFNRMLDRLAAERRQGASAILRAQEEERRRLAQDLHDEVNQALTAVMLRLEATIQAAPPELRRELSETKKLTALAMDQLLRLARELRPTALDDLGLVPALEGQVQRFGDRTGICTQFHVHGQQVLLSDEQQLVVYRVIQESLSNAAQHAEAENIDVELSFVGRTIARVRDDGRGFLDGQPGGSGLSGMRERALLVRGELSVRSRIGAGTVIELTL
jgi:two-component system sensor histidine kinase UhpB